MNTVVSGDNFYHFSKFHAALFIYAFWVWGGFYTNARLKMPGTFLLQAKYLFDYKLSN